MSAAGRFAEPLRRLSAVLTAEEKRRFALLTVATAFLSLSEAFSIGILIPIMGLIVDPGRVTGSAFYARAASALGTEGVGEFLTVLMGAALAVFWLKSAYALAVLRFQHASIGKVRVRLKGEVYGRYLSRPYEFHLSENSAILFKNVTQDVGQFAVGYLGSAVVLVSESLIVAAVTGLLLAAYPKVTAFLIVSLGCLLGVLHVSLKGALRRLSEEREVFNAAKHKTGLEGLSAVKEIQIYGSHERFRDRFAAAVRDYSDSHVSFTTLTFLPRYVLEATLFTAIMAGLLFAVRAGSGAADIVPMLSAFALAALRILPSVNKMQQSFGTAQYYANSLALVHAVVTDPGDADASRTASAPDPFPRGPQEIRLSAVRFAFPGRAPLFSGLELAVPAKRTVALVGESGSGKSTLTDILMGVLEPQGGEVRYGGVRVARGNAPAFWRRIGYVPQQIALLDDSIRANITFGDRAFPDEAVARAVEAAQLGPLIAELPEGLDTAIGERGVRISGGQRQRIGIARALLRDPEVLVLDEATSALDSRTEAQIVQSIRALKGRLTVVVVAHRLTTVEGADTLYMLDKGRVAASGTYAELLASCPEFQRLARIQSAQAG